MRPRVARIVSYLPVGGVERRLLAVLKRLKEDFEVEVICIHSRGKLAPLFEEAGIPVTVIPFKSRLHPVSLYRLASYLRKRRVDIVHTHMYRPNISGTLAARLAGVPVVISNVHNVDHWDTSRQVFMDRLFRPLRNGVIAVSHKVKRNVAEKTDLPPERIKVLYNGVETENFLLSQEERALKAKELKLSRGEKLLLVVARLMPWKGHALLLEVLEEIAPQLPPFRLLMAGRGPTQGELEERISKRGLSWASLLGERHDIPQLFSVSYLSILPSLREGFPNVVLESMAAGVPPIATDAGGTEEALVSLKVGMLVPRGDREALKEAITTLMHHPALVRKMGRRSVKWVRKRFSIESMYRDTKTLYHSLLEEVKGGQQ